MHSTRPQTRHSRTSSPAQAHRSPDWAGLHPVSIAAAGAATEPVERLMGLQSGVYRIFILVGQIALVLRRRPSLPTPMRVRPAAPLRG